MGPEKSFINKVHLKLEPEWEVHKQSNTGIIGTSGTPDYYYERTDRALWIEYKFVKKFPELIMMTDTNKKYSLSALQRRWLNRAYRNNVRVAAVLGSEEGAIIFALQKWELTINSQVNRDAGSILSPQQVALFIAGIGHHRFAL